MQAILNPKSDDYKKLWTMVKAFKNHGEKSNSQFGYQYRSHKANFPFFYEKKLAGVESNKKKE